MTIDLTTLGEDGRRFAGEEPAGILEWDPADDTLQPSSPVHYDFHAALFDTELVLRGRLSCRFTGVCNRCGGPMDLDVREDDFCVSLEVAEENSTVDLTNELREAIILALPSYPVCSPDCPGVCPRCGKRLADGSCGCEERPARGWEALDGLGL